MRRVRVARIVVGVLVVWIAMATFGNLADRLILFPTTDRIDVVHAKRRALAVGEAWVVPARAQPRRYVLRFYGNADRAERWIDDEAASFPDDVEAWGINYPGYGTATGPASLRGVATAALAAYDAVATQAPGAPVYVFGTSLGTTAALYVAAERKVRGVVLVNPPPLRELILGRFGWWNLWLLAYPIARQIPSALDSLSNARRATAPAVIVLSQQDEVVAPAFARRVADAYAGPKNLLLRPDAGHNDPLAGHEARHYADAVTHLFAR